MGLATGGDRGEWIGKSVHSDAMSHDGMLAASIPTRTFVLGMIRNGGELRAEELYRVGTACGLTDQQIRLCLRRLVGEGALLHQAGRGLKAVYHAPAAQSDILPEFDYLAYAYQQDAGDQPWDGQWRLYAFSVPETQRAARDALRVHVLYHGASALHGGVYVSPHDIDTTVASEAARLGITDSLTIAKCAELSIGDERLPQGLAKRLWPVERLETNYSQFADRLAKRLHQRHHTPEEALRSAFLTTFEFALLMQGDPLLPPELLPQPWAGTKARALLVKAQKDLFTRQDLGDASQLLKRLTINRQLKVTAAAPGTS